MFFGFHPVRKCFPVHYLEHYTDNSDSSSPSTGGRHDDDGDDDDDDDEDCPRGELASCVSHVLKPDTKNPIPNRRGMLKTNRPPATYLYKQGSSQPNPPTESSGALGTRVCSQGDGFIRLDYVCMAKPVHSSFLERHFSAPLNLITY